jgi:hypothetical protein
LATGLYSSQIQKQQAEQQAELNKKMLEVQKNQQAIDAYKLLSSSAGREVAVGGNAPASSDLLSGGAGIAAIVAIGALLLLR